MILFGMNLPVLSHGGYSQPYSLGGSSDAASGYRSTVAACFRNCSSHTSCYMLLPRWAEAAVKSYPKRHACCNDVHTCGVSYWNAAVSLNCWQVNRYCCCHFTCTVIALLVQYYLSPGVCVSESLKLTKHFCLHCTSFISGYITRI